jgi:hypothetical protein
MWWETTGIKNSLITLETTYLGYQKKLGPSRNYYLRNYYLNYDGLVKSSNFVTPAKAGVQKLYK